MAEPCEHLHDAPAGAQFPNRHATAHFAESGHPVVGSIEPGEGRRSCFVDEVIG